MQKVRNVRFYIIAALACAILFCIAAFSVSYAKWNGGGGNTSAEVQGESGLFYVEYPYAPPASSVLKDDTYYLAVTNESGSSVFYELGNETQIDYGAKRQRAIEGVYLADGYNAQFYHGLKPVSATIYRDANQGDNPDYHGTSSGVNNSIFTPSFSGTFDFYLKYPPDSKPGYYNLYINSHYTNNIDFKFANNKVIHVVSNSNSVNIHAWYKENGTDKNIFTEPFPGKTVTSDVANTSSTVNNTTELDFTAFTPDQVYIIFSYSKEESNWTTTYQSADSTVSGLFNSYGTYYLGFTETSTQVGYDDNTNRTRTRRLTLTSAAELAPPTPNNATIAVDDDDASEPTDVRNAPMRCDGYDSDKGGYVYHNYICVSRRNSADTVSDNTVAFVEFALYGADGKTALPNTSEQANLVSFSISRTNTDSTGVPTEGTAATPPRIYGYDSGKEGGVKLGDIGPGYWHGSGENKDGDTIDTSKKMVPHFDDGMYCVLYFGDNDQQYFALDVEIVTETEVPDFALVARANNINRWQRFEQGYGKQWGFYMGGLINSVWLWDPSRTMEMTGSPDITGMNDVSEITQEKIKINYPSVEIDYSLTVNLTAGSLVKPYMLDKTGYRRQENGKEPDAATAYLLPKNIIAPDKLYGSSDHYNMNDSVATVRDVNLLIPVTGTYTFRLKGNVVPNSDSTNGTWYINLHSGETKQSKSDPGEANGWYSVPNFNFVVDELYISTVAITEEPHTVTFDPNGGKWNDDQSIVAREQKVPFGGSAIKLENLSKLDESGKPMALVGWYTDAACTTEYDFNSVVTSDITLYAKWQHGGYQITFNVNGGTWNDSEHAIDSVYAYSGETIPHVADPTRGGANLWGNWTEYVFGGWYTEDDKFWSFANDTVTKAITLKAKWLETIYMGNGHEVVVNGVRKNMQSEGEDVYTIKVELNKGDELRFFMNNASHVFTCNNVDNVAVEAGRAYGTVVGDNGWYKLTYNKTTNVLTATTLGVFTITLDLDGGKLSNADAELAEQRIVEGEKATEPSTPTKDGFMVYYVFMGWFADEDKTIRYDFDTPINAVTTIYAKWEELNGFYVRQNDTFTHLVGVNDYCNAHGITDSTILTDIVGAGDSGFVDITLEANDKLYIYVGFSDSANITINNSAVVNAISNKCVTVGMGGDYTIMIHRFGNDVDLYITKQVAFDPNYNGMSATTKFVKLTESLTLVDPAARDGYTFDGWYIAAEGGSKVTIDNLLSGTATVYAHWTENLAPTLSYNDNTYNLVKSATQDNADVEQYEITNLTVEAGKTIVFSYGGTQITLKALGGYLDALNSGAYLIQDGATLHTLAKGTYDLYLKKWKASDGNGEWCLWAGFTKDSTEKMQYITNANNVVYLVGKFAGDSVSTNDYGYQLSFSNNQYSLTDIHLNAGAEVRMRYGNNYCSEVNFNSYSYDSDFISNGTNNYMSVARSGVFSFYLQRETTFADSKLYITFLPDVLGDGDKVNTNQYASTGYDYIIVGTISGWATASGYGMTKLKSVDGKDIYATTIYSPSSNGATQIKIKKPENNWDYQLGKDNVKSSEETGSEDGGNITFNKTGYYRIYLYPGDYSIRIKYLGTTAPSNL